MATSPDSDPNSVRDELAGTQSPVTSSDEPTGGLADRPATVTGGAWPGAFNVIGDVFEQVKKNPQPTYFFVGVYVLLAILGYIANGSASPAQQDGSSFQSLAGLIFLLALPVYSLALADKKIITVGEFMRFDLGRYLTLVAVALLSVLIFVASVIPLLIPLIWTIPWFAVAGYVAVDKKLGPIDSLKESKRLAQDHKGKVWGVIGVMLLLAIGAGILSFIPVVGAVVAALINVLFGGTLATLYRWLQRNVAA